MSDPEQPAPGDEVPADVKSGGPNVCPDCGGSGSVNGGECPACRGTGQVQEAVGGG